MLVQFQMIRPDAKLPVQATGGSAAFDLIIPHRITIHPGQVTMCHMGFAMALPPVACALILPRSGMAASKKLRPANTPGLIDSDYRGEVKVALENFGDNLWKLEAGTKIAQMLIINIPFCNFSTVETLPETYRGIGGFGSTGDHHE